MATMTDHPVLVHVPVGTGASGREALRKFYAEIFIPQIPPDMALQLLTRTGQAGSVATTSRGKAGGRIDSCC
jgi:hypothetical protein